MENWIEHIVEPKRLYLAWQAPEQMRDRFRWAVATLEREDDRVRLRYIDDPDEFSRLNSGRSKDQLWKLGYRGYPAFSTKRSVHEKGVLETFLRRLPPRKRSDFSEYLKQYRLRSGAEFSDFALLGLTGAKLPSDWFSLVDPFDPDAETCERVIEIAGHRYQQTRPGLQPGDAVDFVPEPENPVDSNAVAIHAKGETIGYVNRLQAPTFRHWLQRRNLSGVVERFNGNRERPLVFCFVWVRPLSAQAVA